jgi:hypothetical protein
LERAKNEYEGRNNDTTSSLLVQDTAKSEHAQAPKANRAKETHTNENETKQTSIKSVAANEVRLEETKVDEQPIMLTSDMLTPGMREFLNVFQRKYQEHKGSPPKRNITSTRTAPLRDALGTHSHARYAACSMSFSNQTWRG